METKHKINMIVGMNKLHEIKCAKGINKLSKLKILLI